MTSRLAPAIAALLLLTASAHAQTAAQAASQPATPPSSQSGGAIAPASAAGAANSTSAERTSAPQSNPQPQKNMTEKAVAKLRQAAKSAGNIFSRVPCLPPKRDPKSFGSLPHIARKLASGQPVVIVAFGSSSTAGYGASSVENNYPSRLARQLRRQYPTANITVINDGVGGEDAPEMMKRLQSVIDAHPDLVIWQVGTNAVLRNLDPEETAHLVEEGVARLQAAQTDVVLVDPQYSPRVTEHAESASKMVQLLGKVARLRHVGIFPRFAVMREWHEKQDLPIDSFVYSDGLHMNDWGYACFAQLLGDDIIKSVGQIKIGVNVPPVVQTYRPM